MWHFVAGDKLPSQTLYSDLLFIVSFYIPVLGREQKY